MFSSGFSPSPLTLDEEAETEKVLRVLEAAQFRRREAKKAVKEANVTLTELGPKL
jgi:hypothetical protein